MRTTWIFLVAVSLVGGIGIGIGIGMDGFTATAPPAQLLEADQPEPAVPVRHAVETPAPEVATPIPVTDGHPEGTTVAELTPEQAELVAWAHSRFEQAGLELPDIEVVFDTDRGGCGGAQGLYVGNGKDLNDVTICVGDGDTAGLDVLRRRTLLHEFAHAWDRLNLDDTERERLLALLGTDVWHDPDHELRWEDRGIERFAEVFVHALLDQPRRMVKVPMDCDELVIVFEAATGTSPIGPGLPWCMAEAASS